MLGAVEVGALLENRREESTIGGGLPVDPMEPIVQSPHSWS